LENPLFVEVRMYLVKLLVSLEAGSSGGEESCVEVGDQKIEAWMSLENVWILHSWDILSCVSWWWWWARACV